MPQTFRVRYTPGLAGPPRAVDVLTADVACELAQLAGQLPAGAYVLSVEDLTAGRAVHWSRWPGAFRPGDRDETTGRVIT